MSRMLHTIPKHFQAFPLSAGGSVRHGCDIHRYLLPTVASHCERLHTDEMVLTVEQFITDELATHKRKWEAGSFLDLIKAFLLCTDNGHPIPDWIAEAVKKELISAFNEGTTASGKETTASGKETTASGKAKRGQASPTAKYRNNVIASLRWSNALANRKSLHHWGHPTTREGAFAFASERLRGTIAQGEPDAIEKSYKQVEKARKRGEYIAFDE
jgi:hypothetical protein